VESKFAPKRAVGLKLGLSGAAGVVHLVVPIQVERNSSGITTTGEGPDDASESELAAGCLEVDVGRLNHVGVVVRVARQLNDSPLAQNAHARAPSSLGRRMIARITALREADATAQAIADRLNAEGWRPPKKTAFDAPMVRRLLQRRGLGTRRPIWSKQVPRENEDEVTIQELAEHPGAHRQTVYGWLRRGRITGRLATVGTQRIWLVSRAQASTGTSHRESS